MDLKSIMDASEQESKPIREMIDTIKATEIESRISRLRPLQRQTFWAGLILVTSPLVASLIFVFVKWCEEDCWDWQYVVLAVLATAMVAGLVLITQSGAVNKRLARWEEELRFLHDLKMALEISEQLPAYIQKEPKTIIRENQGTPNAKETEKAADFVFPRQRTQQQIVESLMGRMPK